MSVKKQEAVLTATATPGRNGRLLRRVTVIAAVAMVIIGLALLYLLTQATNNREMYESSYADLFLLNMVVAALLLAAIVWFAIRLYARRRQGRFGSRLLVKLAMIFALLGLAPGVLIYVVSYQFVSRSIESWFDVKVEAALESGLALGRVTLEALSNDLALKTRAVVSPLRITNNGGGSSASELPLEKIVEELSATDVTLWGSAGNLISSAGESRFQLSPEKPTATQMRTARSEPSLYWIDGLDSGPGVNGKPPVASIKVLVAFGASGLSLGGDLRYLLVVRKLPDNLVANALAVENANREYQERSLARNGLQRMYIGTLTLSLFLAIFGAVLLAVLFGNQIARPLLVLTEGVNQVAAGDLGPKLIVQGDDELGGLTRAFASMTQQLADARGAVESSMFDLDGARTNLQTILDNLSAGVLVLNANGTVRSANPAASLILQRELSNHLGSLLADIPGLEQLGQEVQTQFAELETRNREKTTPYWQHTFALDKTKPAMVETTERNVTLVARGADLPDHTRLLVFDDISEIVTAQRSQAWGEVARRLAHEIKNPLTPIQLSAERLERRLGGKLDPADQAVLAKSVKTIVDQVDAMKRLVNEFRDFGRLPAAELALLDINQLVQDVMQLYESAVVPVQLELDPNCPPIRGDAQQLRQVIHNLLQNAQDAHHLHQAAPTNTAVILRTQFASATDRVRLSVLDSGGGFPENILKRAFEPYVTTKARGTGLGLAVVKKIADDHAARIEISNRTQDGLVIGAQVSLSFGIHKAARAEVA